MKARASRRKQGELGGWIGLGLGIAAGWASLVGLYLGFVR